jgi:transcriptional regulator with PAS, ATPase and Fis domain
MRELWQTVERIAPSMVSVLLLGETGAGKGWLAERIHRLSRRAREPFLQISCAALPESLLESELFGYERGAFTGAVQAKPGLLETAHGGTLLLDEVGELPLSTQVKLLRALEQREVLRLGALRPRAVDVRLISATNRDLETEMAEGTFRSDLFFRIEGICLSVPALRERRAEIEGLAEAFLAEAGRREGRATLPRLSAATRRALQEHPWPGNVRELRNVMERALLLCSGAQIEPDQLSLGHGRGTLRRPFGSGRQGGQAHERERILDALACCAGNQSRAARRLGISRRTLISRLDAYGIPRPRKTDSVALA